MNKLFPKPLLVLSGEHQIKRGVGWASNSWGARSHFALTPSFIVKRSIAHQDEQRHHLPSQSLFYVLIVNVAILMDWHYSDYQLVTGQFIFCSILRLTSLLQLITTHSNNLLIWDSCSNKCMKEKEVWGDNSKWVELFSLIHSFCYSYSTVPSLPGRSPPFSFCLLFLPKEKMFFLHFSSLLHMAWFMILCFILCFSIK